MARKKTPKPDPETDGFLSAAARTVGHAAGEAAKALGLENVGNAEGSKGARRASAPKRRGVKAKAGKRVSARSRRITRAAAAKHAAAALKKSAGAEDVRYRRIMGKTSSAWSQQDIDYIERLASTNGHVSQA